MGKFLDKYGEPELLERIAGTTKQFLKQQIPKVPMVVGMSPEQFKGIQEGIYNVVERPIAGLRATAKEGKGTPSTMGEAFVKGFKQPEEYPVGTFAEALVESGMSPNWAGTLGTLADTGYYFGLPEAVSRIATAGKIKLLEATFKHVNEAFSQAGYKETGVVKIPKEVIDTVAKHRDIGTVIEAWSKSRKLQLPKKLTGFTKLFSKPQPAQPGKTTLPQLSGVQNAFNRIRESFDNLLTPKAIVKNVEQGINKWFGESIAGDIQAKFLSDELAKAIPLKRRGILTSYMEQPEKFISQVTDEEKHLADYLRTKLDDFHTLAKDSGILEAYIDNYIPHLYKDDPIKTKKFIYPKGGKLGTKFRFAGKRTIPTIEQAKEKGLHPIEDPSILIGVYARSLHRCIANKHLIELLKGLKNEQGEAVIQRIDKAPKEFVYVNEPSFQRYMYIGAKEIEGQKIPKLVKVPVKIDPEVAQALANITSPYTPPKAWNLAYIKVRSKIKRLIMFNPMIHGWNILSDLYDETALMPWRTVKALKRGAELWRTKDEQVIKWARAGLNVEGAWNVANELREKLLTIPEAKALLPLTKLEEWSDRVLWESIVRNAQLGCAEIKATQIKRQSPHLSEEQISQMVSHYVNDLFGTLPHTIFASKVQREVLTMLFFARNWTISNLRLLTGAMGKYGGKTIVPEMLRHKGLSPEQLGVLGSHYRHHLFKGLLGLVILTNIANKLTSGKWSWQNEEGHKLDVDTGMIDNRGRKIYVVAPWFRYIRDYFGWFSEPMRTIYNKTEPLLKQAIEQSFNFSVWQRNKIAKEGLSFGENAINRLRYFAEGITPIGRLTERAGEVKTPVEWLIPLTGTWIRRGLVGGDSQRKFYEWKQKERRREEKVDQQIDELLQRGQTREAIRYMVETSRYASPQGIQNRIKRFSYPFLTQFESLSKKDRIKFLSTLTAEEQALFMRAVMKGRERKPSKFMKKYGGK